MKKLVSLLICFVLLFGMVSCKKKDDVKLPNDFSIINDVITFTEEEGYTYKVIFVSSEKELKRNVDSGKNVSELNIQAGTYKVYLEVTTPKGNTKRTENGIEYFAKDPNAIASMEGVDMINGRYIKWMGRTRFDEENNYNVLYHAGSSFEINFIGTKVTADVIGLNYKHSAEPWKAPFLTVVVDGDFENAKVIGLTSSLATITLVENLELKEHNVIVYKRSEALDSHIGIKNVVTDGEILEKVTMKDRKIEILGDSTNAGYGNETSRSKGEGKKSSNSNFLETMGFIAANKCNADFNVFCASGWGLTGSAWTNPHTLNLFEEYQKYAPFSEYGWNFSNFTPDVVVVSVGTNDLYYLEMDNRVNFDSRADAFVQRYLDLVELIHNNYGEDTPVIMVWGAMGETRMYPTYERTITALEQTYSNVYNLRVNGDKQAVDYHPSVSSHREMGELLAQKIKEVMNWE